MMQRLIYIIDRGHYFYVSMGLEFGRVRYGCFLRSVRKENSMARLRGGHRVLGLVLLFCIYIMR